MKRAVALSVQAIALVAALSACREKAPPQPDPAVDYRAYVQWSAQRICARLLYCFSGLYRTVTPAMQKEITAENCARAAVQNLDAKLARHTPAMKAASVRCYETLLEVDCLDIGAMAYWDPSCMILRKETDAAYRAAAEQRAGDRAEQ